MSAGQELEKLLTLMARLRAPDGCPWDREQTLQSLRPFVLEEAYELVDALDASEPGRIREELGDLLLEIVFVNQIAEEQSFFRMADVVRQIHDKLVRRHPHVFGGESAGSAGEALERWEDIKAREKKGDDRAASLLDDVPRGLPSLARSQKLSARAARAGFDWASAEEVRNKIDEELTELASAAASGERDAVAEEIGDVLFALVNLSRHLGVDAEVALRDANEKFAARFRYLESTLAAEGRSVEATDMEELERLWKEAKTQGKQGG
jgi:MazG family protein